MEVVFLRDTGGDPLQGTEMDLAMEGLQLREFAEGEVWCEFLVLWWDDPFLTILLLSR
jgi:hypothetical protein